MTRDRLVGPGCDHDGERNPARRACYGSSTLLREPQRVLFHQYYSEDFSKSRIGGDSGRTNQSDYRGRKRSDRAEH